MSTLSIEWSRSLGLEVAIVNAPMGGASGGALAAAVSRAGGLGMVGMGSAGSAEHLNAALRVLGDVGRPFGIGLVDWVVRQQPDLLTVALAARPTLLSVSFGDNARWVRQAHDAGVLAAAQVSDLQEAHRAVDAGVDVVIARGAEAGGHGGVDRYSFRGVYAGFDTGAGATGVAGRERHRHHHHQGFDIAHGYAWPPQLPERVVRDRLVDTWSGRDSEVAADDAARYALTSAQSGVNAGQGVGLLRSVRSAAEVIDELESDARRLLDRW